MLDARPPACSDSKAVAPVAEDRLDHSAPRRRLHSGHRLGGMSQVVNLARTASDDTLWAVVASLGRKTRVAEVYASRAAALADRAWREQQVAAYAGFIRTARQPVPNYSVAPVRRADLPRGWKPLPALGFLRGQFV
jgi:hypothetical protein